MPEIMVRPRPDPTRGGEPLAALAARYVALRARQGRFAPTTVRTVTSTLRRFTAAVGDVPASRLRERHVTAWLAGAGTPATAAARLSQVRGFCRWLVESGHLRADPTAAVAGPSQRRTVPRVLPHGQVEALLGACPDSRARLIVSLMIQEGLRCCEVSRLELGDVDPVERLMLVRGKGGHERVLPITDETWEALAAYLDDEAAPAGPLIRSHLDGRSPIPPERVSQLVAGWMRRAGIKQARRDGRSAHALRRTAATDMLRGGAALHDVQAVLGHTSLATTSRYLAADPSGLRRAIGNRRYGAAP